MADATQSSLHVGSVLGRYELLLPIAKGGMAQVWAARLRGSRGFQKLVAIKTILPDVMDNTRMERMFLEEAQLASQIHHPNVVQTLELGEHEGTLYLVMEWVDGEPLHRIMQQLSEHGSLPLPIAVNLIGQACEGLQAAHDVRDDTGALLGVVHRDVSPQNLLVGFSGTAKLVDFGIAKVTAKSTGLTQAGEVKGKFAYMAPEQVRGQLVDARTDLFSLGILLYAITTGRHPFRGGHAGETLQNICSGRPAAPPSSFLADYPSELEAVLLKALAKEPEQRFVSAREMLTALQQAFPSALAAGFETEVADFLKSMLGAQSLERRAAIRNAQQELDRQRADASASSVGTLRAISISQEESGQFSLEPTPVPPLSVPQVDGAASIWRSKRAGAAVVGASLLVALGALVQLGRGPATAGSAAASSPVPREVASFGPSPVAGAAVPVTNVPSSAVPSAAPVASEASSRKSKRAPIHVALPRAQGPATPAPAAVAPTPPSPPSKPEPPPSTSTNAWDRGAFGGRH
ncbi:MAG TPA: serine/threonine-protein kinase [Polyangiaceae bacterium]|nr:serine/threonine-protein kinase [Polyangiaceae bacterium]